jgi:L-arabinose isomerase
MNIPKVGLLPLYLELYDEVIPENRIQMEAFLKDVSKEIERRNIIVKQSPVCSRREEFYRAVQYFEEEKVDAILTLHLAYSPSLESVEALSATKIPIIILDTTPAYSFNIRTTSEEIMRNHGIHGVQDMCNVLIKRNKDFIIEAGHWEKSDVLDRVAKHIRASMLASSISRIRVGSIGGPFKGMGDFYVPPEILKKTIGIETIDTSTEDIVKLIPSKEEDEVKEEIRYDKENFLIKNLSGKAHLNTTTTGIAIRRWIKSKSLGAFTINFSAIDKSSGFPTFPFLEASKQMANGVGYAGEGDVLTASLVGSLLKMCPDVSFIEMFCPDWEGNCIFLSHMGEMNISLTSEKPVLMEKDLPFLGVNNPAIAFGRFKHGDAVLVNLAPSHEETYKLIVSPVKMLEVKGKDKLEDSIHGWFRADVAVNDFLKEFSIAGGTHHSAIVYGDFLTEIISFGKIMGWNVINIH